MSRLKQSCCTGESKLQEGLDSPAWWYLARPSTRLLAYSNGPIRVDVIAAEANGSWTISCGLQSECCRVVFITQVRSTGTRAIYMASLIPESLMEKMGCTMLKPRTRLWVALSAAGG
jgi:hypothetical protein